MIIPAVVIKAAKVVATTYQTAKDVTLAVKELLTGDEGPSHPLTYKDVEHQRKQAASAARPYPPRPSPPSSPPPASPTIPAVPGRMPRNGSPPKR